MSVYLRVPCYKIYYDGCEVYARCLHFSVRNAFSFITVVFIVNNTIIYSIF